jgi:hypothetical protein
MKTQGVLSAIGGVLDTLGSAVAVSRAVKAGRTPPAADLRRLGIDPAAFGSIRRN